MRYDRQFNLTIVLQDLTENFFDCRAVSKVFGSIEFDLLVDPEVAANLYCICIGKVA